MNIKALIALSSLALLVACEQAVEVDYDAVPVDALARGVELMPTYCHTCHGVGESTMESILAPPLWGVRAHYLVKYPEPQAFVDAMTAFLLEPKAENSLLPLELGRYGLKAPVSLSRSELRAVAWAIYAGRVERPSWSREYKKAHRDCEASW